MGPVVDRCDLSWLAYLITLVVTVVLLAITLMRIKKTYLNKEPRTEVRSRHHGQEDVLTTPTKITADDLRDKLQGLQGEVQGKVDDKKTDASPASPPAACLLMMILFFLLGKRSGKKKSAIVEIRRI